MDKTLSPEAVGIRGLTLPGALDLAREAGFDSLVFDIRVAAQLAEERGTGYVRSLFDTTGVRPGAWGLPVAWQVPQWAEDLRALPRLAALGRELGCTRTFTWLPSGSNERPYRENLDWHIERFRPIAEILRAEGCQLGLEFLGPLTYRARFRYEFIHTLDELMNLARDVGTGNVGVLLDSWHLYTSGGTAADLDRLSARDVIVVHVNDAPAGIPPDEQIDTVRTLPMATGVIDLCGFMGKLRALGYDGPVVPEPFNQPLNDLAAGDPAAAARETAQSMDQLWRAAGLD